MGFAMTHVYGLTEVYGPASVCAEQPGWDDLAPDQRAQLKRRQGVSYPLQEAVTVIDPSTMREVPRDGETIGTVEVASTSADELIRMMVGRELQTATRSQRIAGETVLMSP